MWNGELRMPRLSFSLMLFGARLGAAKSREVHEDFFAMWENVGTDLPNQIRP